MGARAGLACVAGFKRGRGNLSARERVVRAREKGKEIPLLPPPSRVVSRPFPSPSLSLPRKLGPVSIFNLLEQQDKSAFKRAINIHMLGAIIPKEKELVYNLRRRRCHLPQIKTERYKKTFVNRLIFKYNLV